MSISRTPWVRHAPAIRIMLAAAALFAGAAEAGCARSAATTPAPPAASSRGVAGLDPGEEVTPEELSTIPEPVPGTYPDAFEARARSPLREPQEAPQRDSLAARAPARARGSLWQVQIFATQDRDLADRMAMEAGDLLRVPASVAYEPPHYKVRLGDCVPEEDARPLRERAVRSGFAGAFRIRCARGITDNVN